MLKFFALLGDVLVFYLALFSAILIRYQGFPTIRFLEHLPAFSILLLAWIFFGYLSGIYELEVFINDRRFAFRLNRLLFIQALVMLFVFYFLPFFSINPRVIFLIFILAFSVLMYIWRSTFNSFAASKRKNRKVILIGASRSAEKLARFLEANPQFGLSVTAHITSPVAQADFQSSDADFLISSGIYLKDSLFAEASNLNSRDLPLFTVLEAYRGVFRFFPIEEFVHETKMHVAPRESRFFSGLKRAFELMASGVLVVLLSPIFVLIAVAIWLNSKGKIFYSQIRSGKDGQPFKLYKFRSMSSDENINPDGLGSVPIWSTGKEDSRVTAVGKFLRSTHLDELPQLINIFKGDMSFIGPRPERPEFDKELIAQIPHYEMRYAMKPGVTGWAQINYPYAASVEQARERLEHDLYYLFERSLILDVRILLKTLRHFFIRT